MPKANQLASVDDVFNAVLVKGDMLGDVVFYGKGAGKLPTASAVVADVVDALKHGSKVHDSLFWQPAEPVGRDAHRPRACRILCACGGHRPRRWPRPSTAGAMWWKSISTAAPTLWTAPTTRLCRSSRKVEAMGGSVKLVLRRLPEDA